MRSGSAQTRGPRVWGSGPRVLVPMARPKAQDNPPKRFQRVKSHLENDIAGLGPPGTWCIPGGERPTQIDRHRSRSGRISAKFGCGSRVMMCADRLVRFREKTDRSPVEKNRDLEMHVSVDSRVQAWLYAFPHGLVQLLRHPLMPWQGSMPQRWQVTHVGHVLPS